VRLETRARFWESVCMSEIIFEVREAEEGGFFARALGYSIFTQGEDWEDLRRMVKDAVACHFEQEAERPKVIRLHYVRDEVLAA
jgi:predicted RNase H-like HicB family nuclease